MHLSRHTHLRSRTRHRTLLGLALHVVLLVAAGVVSTATNVRADVPVDKESSNVTKYQAITSISHEKGSRRVLQGLGLMLSAGLTWLFVRFVRTETRAARKAELDGWVLPERNEALEDAPEGARIGQEITASCQSVGPESEQDAVDPEAWPLPDVREAEKTSVPLASAIDDTSSSPARKIVAHSLGRTRLIYHVGQYHFQADRQVVGAATLSHLDDLCDMLCSPDNTRRVLRVASGLSCRYAKSQVTAQLAQMLADRKLRVLALEGDLDAPALHKVLHVNIPRTHGLTEQLQRMADANQVDTITVLQLSETLHALAESRWSTPAALALPQFAEVLTQQRNVYDFVVIDGPVVDSWPDADHFGRQVEGVVFVTLTSARLPDTLTLLGQHFAHELLLRIVKAGDATGS